MRSHTKTELHNRVNDLVEKFAEEMVDDVYANTLNDKKREICIDITRDMLVEYLKESLGK